MSIIHHLGHHLFQLQVGQLEDQTQTAEKVLLVLCNVGFFCFVFVCFLKKYLFIYLFLAALGLRCCEWAFSSCCELGLLFVVVHELLIEMASLVVEHRIQARGLQQLWPTGSRAQSQQWRTGLLAPRHVGSSQTRARTRVACIGRRILNHCATREVR